MNPQDIHLSQFESNLPIPIQKTACGPTCISQVIKYLTLTEPSNKNLIRDFIKSGRYTIPTVDVIFNKLPDTNIPIRFLDQNSNTASQVNLANELVTNYYPEKPNETWSIQVNPTISDNYQPSFILEKGSDSRGIVTFLKNMRLNTQLFEFWDKIIPNPSNSIKYIATRNLFIDEFLKNAHSNPSANHKAIIASVAIEQMNYSTNTLNLLSVTNSPPQTHLVTILPQPNTETILVIDPAISDKRKAVRQISTQDFLPALVSDQHSPSHFIVAHT